MTRMAMTIQIALACMAIAIGGCHKHVPTVQERCDALQHQSVLDKARYDKGDWSRADQDRFDAGFAEYVQSCLDKTGKGIGR